MLSHGSVPLCQSVLPYLTLPSNPLVQHPQGVFPRMLHWFLWNMLARSISSRSRDCTFPRVLTFSLSCLPASDRDRRTASKWCLHEQVITASDWSWSHQWLWEVLYKIPCNCPIEGEVAGIFIHQPLPLVVRGLLLGVLTYPLFWLALHAGQEDSQAVRHRGLKRKSPVCMEIVP